MEERLNQYWRQAIAALIGLALFQLYRRHLIYLGAEADTVMSFLFAVVFGVAYLGIEDIYSTYFEVSGQSGKPEKTE